MFLNKEALGQSRVRLEFFFCLAYAVQGICQHFCLIAQPLDFYLMRTCGMNAAQVSNLMALLMVPWVIKPLYGCVSDLFPLFGDRIRPYLLMAFVIAGLGFAGLASLSGANSTVVLSLVFLTSLGMAAGNTLCCGLTVRVGNANGSTRYLLSLEAASYYLLNIVSMLVGGWLCQTWGPAKALPVAAGIACLPCFVAGVAGLKLIESDNKKLSLENVREIAGAMKQLILMERLWLAALFICLWNFSPGLSTPLYFFESNKLHFSQTFIGQLGGINAAGMLSGAVLFRFAEKRLPWSKLLPASVIFSALSVIGYVCLRTELSAMILEFLRGTGAMFACLAVYSVVAEHCVERVESSMVALLISVYNIAGQAGTVFGGQLYSVWCKDNLLPLLGVSAGTTLLCLFVVPSILKSGANLKTDVVKNV